MRNLGLLVFDLLRAERAGLPGLEARQRRRLGALVTHAREHSPLYRRAYGALPAQGVELAQLPPVNKPQLMAAFDDGLAVEPRITRAEVEAFVADRASPVGATMSSTSKARRAAGSRSSPLPSA